MALKIGLIFWVIASKRLKKTIKFRFGGFYFIKTIIRKSDVKNEILFKKLIKTNYLVRLMTLGGIISILASCTVITGVYDRNRFSIKPSNLNIVRGQPLEIYFERLYQPEQKDADIKAWESTQLFSSVTSTTLDQPSSHGYFLRVTCKRDNWDTDVPFLMTTMLWWMTAFTFPSPESTRQNCDLIMYENGIQIVSDTAELGYEQWSGGWALIPHYFQRPSIYATHAQSAANIRVRNLMFALTKEAK